jgi:hypothetical protein
LGAITFLAADALPGTDLYSVSFIEQNFPISFAAVHNIGTRCRFQEDLCSAAISPSSPAPLGNPMSGSIAVVHALVDGAA